MNLYLVERKGDVDWDEYRAMVVVAHTINEAKKVRPGGSGFWPDPNGLTATRVGSARVGFSAGEIILADFNAG